MKQTPAFGIWIVLDQDELFFRRAEKSKIGFKKGFGSESPAQVTQVLDILGEKLWRTCVRPRD